MNNDKKFVFREQYLDVCMNIENPMIRLAMYDAVLSYGVWGECMKCNYDFSKDEMQLIDSNMQMIFSSIEDEKEREQYYSQNVQKNRKKRKFSKGKAYQMHQICNPNFEEEVQSYFKTHPEQEDYSHIFG